MEKFKETEKGKELLQAIADATGWPSREVLPLFEKLAPFAMNDRELASWENAGDFVEPVPNWTTDYGKASEWASMHMVCQGFHPKEGAIMICHPKSLNPDGMPGIEFSVVGDDFRVNFTSQTGLEGWLEYNRVSIQDPLKPIKWVVSE